MRQPENDNKCKKLWFHLQNMQWLEEKNKINVKDEKPHMQVTTPAKNKYQW